MKKSTKESIRLNKYIANAGLCNRRKADSHILAGKVKVNGKIVSKLGSKITHEDEVTFENKLISPKQKTVYLLINKPQNFTAFKSTKKNIWKLISEFDSKRLKILHPLKETSAGLILVTSDSTLIDKLIQTVTKKLYYLQLENPLENKELRQLEMSANKAGLNVQNIDFVQNKPKSHIGIEVYDKMDADLLKMLKQMNLKVLKLDRVMFGGITKKDLPRGRWRHLTEKEIITLKHF